MAAYTLPSPLAGYEDAPPLPDERSEGDDNYENPQTGVLSSAYDQFPDPLDTGRTCAFGVHVYYLQTNEAQVRYARELWERIRREFPELRIYRLWGTPVGPHPVAMFEFGAFIPWLAIWRGPLSVLVYPNPTKGANSLEWVAEETWQIETQSAICMGERFSPRHLEFRGLVLRP